MATSSKDSIRYWAGAVGAAAMVAGIVSVVVMVQMQKPKTKAAAPQRTVAAPETRPASKPPAWTVTAAQQSKAAAAPQAKAAVPPTPLHTETSPRTEAPSRTVASIQTPAKAQPEPRAAAPVAKALTDTDRKMSEDLWAEQKRLDTASAKMTAAKSDGRRRLTAMLAKQYNVPEKLISDLRDKKLGYGEISASLAFSQQLMKRDKSTRQQALDRVLAARKAGQGWAAFAKDRGLKIADALTEVRKTEQQVAKTIG